MLPLTTARGVFPKFLVSCLLLAALFLALLLTDAPQPHTAPESSLSLSPAETTDPPAPVSPIGHAHSATGSSADSLAEGQSLLTEKTLLVFTEFDDWLVQWQKAGQRAGSSQPSKEQVRLLEKGRELAHARSDLLLELMRHEPETALQHALTLAEWAGLPLEIQELVEEPFSGTGRYSIFPDCAGNGSVSGVETRLRGRDESWETHVFGPRREVLSKQFTLLQGIELAGEAVLRPQVFQELAGADLQVARALYDPGNPNPAICFATGEPLGPEAVTALAGGHLFAFRDRLTLEGFEQQALQLEQARSPRVSSAMILEPVLASGGTVSSGGFDMQGALVAAASDASGWTTTVMDVLYIRVDFSDVPSDEKIPTDSSLLTSANGEVDEKIQTFSYGKTGITAAVTPRYSLGTKSSYNPANNAGAMDNLHTAAVNAAISNLGSSYVNSFDVRVVVFPYLNFPSVSWTGLATLGGSRQWLQGRSAANNFSGFDRETMVHELGHNYGVDHASTWFPGSNLSNPVEPYPQGSWSEYGDPVDIMGEGPWDIGHFNVMHKQRLNWLTGGQIQAISTEPASPVRLYRYDSPQATLLQAIEVPKKPNQSYWLGYRFLNSSPSETAHWLELVWEQPDPPGGTRDFRSYLVNPQTGEEGYQGIPVGYTYTDTSATVPVHITPVGQGGEEPNQYLDVTVKFGTAAGVSVPNATINGPATLPARTPVAYSLGGVSGTEQSIAFGWSKADDYTSAFDPERTVSWPWGGSKTLEVTLSNMRGGKKTVSRNVTVEDPLLNWNSRAAYPNFYDIADVATNGSVAVVAAGLSSGYLFDPLDFPSYDKLVLRYTTDGSNWLKGDVLGANSELNIYIKGLTYGNGLFVAVGVGLNNLQTGFAPRIWTSPDGISWTQRYAQESADELKDVTYRSGVGFVATGENGRVLFSSNGTSWAPVTLPSGTTTLDYLGAGVSGTHFFISGYGGMGVPGTLLRSSNGTSWTDITGQSPIGDSEVFETIYPVGDSVVFSGINAEVYTATPDGTDFAQATIDDLTVFTPDSKGNYDLDLVDFSGIARGNDVTLAVGRENQTVDPQFLFLSFGSSYWYVQPLADTTPRNAVAFFNNTFLMVGDNGLLRQSDPFLRPGEGWSNWLLQFPGYIGQSVSPTGNSDFDSETNLVEYALGSDPLEPGDVPHPELSVENGRLCLTVERPQNRQDVQYTVEISYNLSTWTPVTTTPLIDNETTLKVCAPHLLSDPAYPDQYLRLKVTLTGA